MIAICTVCLQVWSAWREGPKDDQRVGRSDGDGRVHGCVRAAEPHRVGKRLCIRFHRADKAH